MLLTGCGASPMGFSSIICRNVASTEHSQTYTYKHRPTQPHIDIDSDR